jgi:hypothetical protein
MYRRVCISQAALSAFNDRAHQVQMALAFSVFGWATPSSDPWRLARRPDRAPVLMRIVLWWSFFTAATGWVWNLTSLLVPALFRHRRGGAPNLTRALPPGCENGA